MIRWGIAYGVLAVAPLLGIAALRPLRPPGRKGRSEPVVSVLKDDPNAHHEIRTACVRFSG